MSYLVLARKWRPQTFTDLVGQAHVSRTLENAIAQNRVAHAFLFTGVRGVGKTTSARILAKALNCVNGPTASPCLVCPACVDIAAGTDLDVLEIDGASYTGVDEVRRLQEGLPYRPQRDRFKVIIVDEVHMLSSNAWNAFLKTLEEPPPHVKFIFATTEVHKIPVTILSRCQRYDFKMLTAQTIGARLRWVLEQEKIEADDAAVSLLAREAAGSMRDGMSLLDQAIAWGGEKLVGEDVARVLGVASRSVLRDLMEAVIGGNAEGALKVVADLVDNGYDLGQLTRHILGYARDLVVAKVAKSDAAKLLDLADAERAEVTTLAEKADADDLVRLHQGLSRSFDETVKSLHPRASLEMTLVRLARRPALLPLDDLLVRLGALEQRLAQGLPPPGGGSSSGGLPPRGGARPATSSSSPLGGAPSASRPSFAPEAPTQRADYPRPSNVRPIASVGSAAVAMLDDPNPEPPAPSAPPSRPNTLRSVALPSRGRGATFAPDEPLPDAPPGLDLGRFRALVELVRASRPPFAAFLELSAPRVVEDGKLVIALPNDAFFTAQATSSENVELLTQVARQKLGPSCEVVFETIDDPKKALTLSKIDARDRYEKRLAAQKEVEAHPLVRAAIEILGAELADVKIPDLFTPRRGRRGGAGGRPSAPSRA